VKQPQASLNVYRFGVFEFEPRAGELRKRGVKIKLQGQPLDILKMLLERPGELLTRDELQKKLWPSDTFVDFDHSLNAAIKRLRDALDDSAGTPRYVETVARRGYRFVAPVEAPAQEVRSEQRASRRPQFRWRASIVFGIVAAALVLALVGAAIAYKFGGRDQVIDSVVILPFANAGSDPDTEYLSDGITESLINSLSQLSTLKVMSRDSAFHYKDREADARAVGRELGVRAVFKGRVSHFNDTLTISAELIDARDNSHIWGQQYSRTPSDVFALPGELAKEITTTLRMRLTGSDERRMAKSYTANPEAYQDYLKGRYWWNKRTEDALKKSIEYFQQAIAKDPTYALAYSGLADSYTLLAVYFSPPKEAFPRAKEAALKALELDETLAEAHVSLARVKAEYDWDWIEGEREFQRAIELNPNYATGHQWYGDILDTMGRPQEAVAEYNRALKLDPLSLIINRGFGQALIYARQYDQAVEQLQKTLELDPYFPGTSLALSRAYLHNSMYKEGVAEAEKWLAISEKGLVFPPADNPYALSGVAYAYAVAGRRADAQKVLDRLNEQSYSPRPLDQIYAALGEKDKAFELLEKGYKGRTIGLGGEDMKVNPAYDPVRSDPRFADLLRRMNLQQ
jgi:TolB-like protein/DNA-binding winged helix-turn-helix (wHTH) protein